LKAVAEAAIAPVDHDGDLWNGARVRMKVASWNVNSIRARLDAVLGWLDENAPDVLCMQETKVVDDEFPSEEFQRLGYSVSASGQSTYNGVAILSRLPELDVRLGLDDEAKADGKRLISARIAGVRILSVYVPNGKSVESDDFVHKLAWLERLRQTVSRIPEQDVLLCGDFNIAREARDVFDVERMRGNLFFHPKEHEAFDRLLKLGFEDSLRLFHPEAGLYSWWDYRAGAFRRNRGLRIDYILVSTRLATRCRGASIDKKERARPKPSDHAPLLVVLED
jgi:exodeoxyribonuclease-3